MRQFASKGFRLWQLGSPAKLVYTAFCVFTLLGLASSVAYFVDLMGVSAGGARRYYRGSAEVTQPVGAAPVGGTGDEKKGPSVELPTDDPKQPLTLEVPYRKLLEVSHFHLFTVPVVLLIIAHLFMLTDLAERTKIVWIALASVGSLAHLVAPWLVRYASASSAVLMPITGVWMLGTMTVLTAYPVYAMWFGAPAGGARRASATPSDDPA